MIVKNGTDAGIEERKAAFGLEGDVYIYEGHFIEDMAGHRRLIPESTASTIEEAYQERVEYEARRAAELAAAAEANIEEVEGEDNADDH